MRDLDADYLSVTEEIEASTPSEYRPLVRLWLGVIEVAAADACSDPGGKRAAARRDAIDFFKFPNRGKGCHGNDGWDLQTLADNIEGLTGVILPVARMRAKFLAPVPRPKREIAPRIQPLRKQRRAA